MKENVKCYTEEVLYHNNVMKVKFKVKRWYLHDEQSK